MESLQKGRNIKEILDKLPDQIGRELKGVPKNVIENLEEIRLRTGQDLRLLSGGLEYVLACKIDNETLNIALNNILNHSYYAYEEELAKGYITIEGGHRIGICGRTVVEKGSVRLIKDISSLNIRCCREMKGISDECIRYVLKNNTEIYNTIIVSPPKCGKTTLLRDLIRNLSHRKFHMGVCDERSELAGMYMGRPSFDMGANTDILDGCPKEQGMIMLIRSMAPDIIATDEIGKKDDIYALEAALCAGIGIITTIHGSSYEDIKNSGIGEVVARGAFQRIIFLTNNPKIGTIKEVRNG